MKSNVQTCIAFVLAVGVLAAVPNGADRGTRPSPAASQTINTTPPFVVAQYNPCPGGHCR
jgi:hypothetical protein